jgi:hypothetical protein
MRRLTGIYYILYTYTSIIQHGVNSKKPLREERQRRRAVDTVWRLKMKGFSKISL